MPPIWAGDPVLFIPPTVFCHSVSVGGWGRYSFICVYVSFCSIKQLIILSLTILNPQVLLQAVLPFDLLLDRKKRIDFFNKLVANSNLETTPKVVRDAAFALGTLVVCEEALERELFISTSYVLLKNQCNTSGIKEKAT